MARLLPIMFGALQIGLVGAATFVLCSTNVLNEASVFLTH